MLSQLLQLQLPHPADALTFARQQHRTDYCAVVSRINVVIANTNIMFSTI